MTDKERIAELLCKQATDKEWYETYGEEKVRWMDEAEEMLELIKELGYTNQTETDVPIGVTCHHEREENGIWWIVWGADFPQDKPGRKEHPESWALEEAYQQGKKDRLVLKDKKKAIIRIICSHCIADKCPEICMPYDAPCNDCFSMLKEITSLLPVPELTRRPELEWFASEMEKVLKNNDHKHGIATTKEFRNLVDEVFELDREMQKGNTTFLEHCPDAIKLRVIKECVDVANYAMMIASDYHKAQLLHDRETLKGEI